jgi:hypothetical protein
MRNKTREKEMYIKIRVMENKRYWGNHHVSACQMTELQWYEHPGERNKFAKYLRQIKE